MEYLKDAENRYRSPSGMIAAYTPDDIDGMEQCLRILRYRMLGKTWEEIGIIEKERYTTLYQRLLAYFGPLIAKYDFKDGSRLPEEFRGLYRGDCSNPEFSAAAANSGKYVWVPLRELQANKTATRVAELKAEFKREMKKKTGVDWNTAIRLRYMDSFDGLSRVVDNSEYDVAGCSSKFTVHDYIPANSADLPDRLIEDIKDWGYGPLEWAIEERYRAGLPDFESYWAEHECDCLWELYELNDPFWARYYREVEGIRVPFYERCTGTQVHQQGRAYRL